MVGFDVMATPRAEDWIPRPGTVIDGRYRVEAIVGNGTMGAVVSARHLVLDRSVAIKLLRPERAGDSVAVERFRQEASAASRIRSDHVVRIHDVGATEGALPFMAMELLEGIDLEKLTARGPLSVQVAADCILQAAEALAEAHASGIVHRDIKPSNLYLTERADGSPCLKVLDFGISKLAPERGGDPSLTATQAVIGSPAYMAPEQIRASKYVTAKADVWALGIVLFEILTTKLPFDGDTVGSVLAHVTTSPPPSLRALRPDVPEAIEATVLACLDKDPATRATLGDLAAALRPFASPIGAVSAERAIRICGASLAGRTAPAALRGSGASTSSTAPVPSGRGDGRSTLTASPRRVIALVVMGCVGLGAVLTLGIAIAIGRGASTDEAPAEIAPLPLGTLGSTSTVEASTSAAAVMPEPTASTSTRPAPRKPAPRHSKSRR